MALEECAEFIMSIAKLQRKTNGTTLDGVCDEIADVKIMMEQMHLIFPDELIKTHREEKLKRLAERIGKDYGGET